MSNASPSGSGDGPSLAPLILPEALNGYRRKLCHGRGVSVYCDQHPPNTWLEHSHEQMQLSFSLDGVGSRLKWQRPDGEWREEELSGLQVWLMPPGMRHALHRPEAGSMVTLFLERDFVQSVTTANPTEPVIIDLIRLGCRDVVILQLAEAFRPLCLDEKHGGRFYPESAGTMLATHALWALFAGAGLLEPTDGLPTPVRQRVATYIAEHMAEPYDLEVLAKVAGYSCSHFERLFRESWKMTPLHYLRVCRVYKAEALLLTTRKKITEIAEMVGFGYEGTMTRWFRRVLKCRPSEVRRRKRP